MLSGTVAHLASHLAAIVDSSDDAIIGKDLNGTITAWNNAAEEMFGYPASEAIGRPIAMLATRGVADEMPAILDKIRGGERVAHYETLRRRKDGSEIAVSLTVSPIRDDDGRVVGASKIARDITARKRAERDLKRAEENFRLVVETVPNSIVVVGADGRIALVNCQTEKLFGYERSEMLGQPVDMLVPRRYRASHGGRRDEFFGAPTARAMGTGRDLYGVRKDGSEVQIEIGLNPIDSAQGTLVFASIIDITERKRSEEAARQALEAQVAERTAALRRSLREKETLLKEVHHRVKNNLQVIASLLSIQEHAMKESGAAAALRESQQRVVAMALIHERLYGGPQLDEIDFGDYARALVNELISSFEARPGLLAARFQTSAVRLGIEQAIPCGLILNELITNALKYAYPGNQGGEVLVELNDSETGHVSLSVSDHGVGLPQGLDWENPASMGLTIVGLLAKQLQGSLTVEAGTGVRFTVRFPLPAKDAKAAGAF